MKKREDADKLRCKPSGVQQNFNTFEYSSRYIRRIVLFQFCRIIEYLRDGRKNRATYANARLSLFIISRENVSRGYFRDKSLIANASRDFTLRHARLAAFGRRVRSSPSGSLETRRSLTRDISRGSRRGDDGTPTSPTDKAAHKVVSSGYLPARAAGDNARSRNGVGERLCVGTASDYGTRFNTRAKWTNGRYRRGRPIDSTGGESRATPASFSDANRDSTNSDRVTIMLFPPTLILIVSVIFLIIFPVPRKMLGFVFGRRSIIIGYSSKRKIGCD